MSTLGTAQDITLQELRVESFYPADPESERLFRGAFESRADAPLADDRAYVY